MKFSLILSGFFLFVISLSAQKRFQSQFFLSSDSILNVQANLDLFTPPQSDTLQLRPLIIYISGQDAHYINYFKLFANDFSKKGYIVANLKYDINASNSTNLKLAVKKLGNNLITAVNFLKLNAKIYSIDTSQIFLTGSQVGSTVAMSVVYNLNNTAAPTNQIFNGVINIGGALMDTSFIKEGSAPLFNVSAIHYKDSIFNANLKVNGFKFDGYELYKKSVESGNGTGWLSLNRTGYTQKIINQYYEKVMNTSSAWLFTQLKYNKINNREDVHRYEKEILKFDSLNAIQKDAPNSILFLGSSYIRLWTNIRQDIDYANIIHRGFGGSNLKDVAFYLKRIVYPHQPKAIFMYVGNDIIVDDRDKTPEQSLELFKLIVGLIRMKYPTTPITWLAISPSEKRWAEWSKIKNTNALIENYCITNHNLYFLDASSQFLGKDSKPISNLYREDKLHYNEEGYKVWGNFLKQAVLNITLK